MWRAVVSRAAAADGRFVYAVRSTGVYCRPNCKARRARRANVGFYADAAAAEAAGFRACKRCRPQAEGAMPEDAARARVRALTERATRPAAAATQAQPEAGSPPTATAAGTTRTARRPHSTAALAAQAGVSRWHFHRTFKALTGQTPGAYLRARAAHGGPAENAGHQADAVPGLADCLEAVDPDALQTPAAVFCSRPRDAAAAGWMDPEQWTCDGTADGGAGLDDGLGDGLLAQLLLLEAAEGSLEGAA